jgi:hypothetical protein
MPRISHFISLISTSFYPYLGLTNCLLPSDFRTKLLYIHTCTFLIARVLHAQPTLSSSTLSLCGGKFLTSCGTSNLFRRNRSCSYLIAINGVHILLIIKPLHSENTQANDEEPIAVSEYCPQSAELYQHLVFMVDC